MAEFNTDRHSKIEIGKRIVSIRESLKMSQPKFAELVGLSSNFLSQVENGNKGLSADSVARISTKTGYSTDYILLGKSGSNIVSPDTRRQIKEHLMKSIKLLDDQN